LRVDIYNNCGDWSGTEQGVGAKLQNLKNDERRGQWQVTVALRLLRDIE